MARTITANNAVFMLAVAGVFSTPQRLQQFSADDVFDTEPIEPTETMMGVDGNLTAGFVFVPTPQSVTLMADSPSNDLFEAWMAASRAARDVIYANATIRLPSIGKSYALTKGVLQRMPQFAGAKKVLQPRVYGLLWESVTSAPV
jgi:hypothetical protein